MALLVFFINVGFSQDLKLCKTPEMNKLMQEKHPEMKQERIDLEKFTKQYIANKNITDEVYVIPIVFHIVHNNGTENISKEQILDAVRILNEDFRKQNADTTQIVSAFKSIAADSYIEFRLAKIDPDGNCTEGITRTQSVLTTNAGENVKYLAPAWPRDKYFNVWVVKSVDGAAGYAYYPSDWLDPEVDGVILNNTYIGSIGTGTYTRSRALTHEIGHSMNLMHPWGNSNDPGLAENCYDDDEVEDTPNTIGNTTCILTAESCGSLDNVQNYMEYSYCTKMYTYGQKDRMRAALNSYTGDRYYLWQADNLVATGTNDGYISMACIPTVEFGINYTNVCADYLVQYNDLSYNAEVDSSWSWNWSFPGGIPSSSTEQNPLVKYSSGDSYDVSLTVANSTGSNSLSKSAVVSVFNTDSGESAPVFQGFESSSFPTNTSDAEKNWFIESGSDQTWYRTTYASASGNASLVLRNNYIYSGTKNSFTSPNIILGNNTISATLTFKVAYARSSISSTDYLKVYVSPNCGRTWHLRYARSGATLATNGGVYVTNAFIPDAEEWRQDNVSLAGYADSTMMRIKFECTSGDGNYLYIDDIDLTIVTSDQSEEEIIQSANVYPNPFNNSATISYSLNQVSDVSIVIYDIAGKQIGFIQKTNMVGNHEIQVAEIADIKTEGIYFVNIKINDYSLTRKMIKIE